MNTRSEPDCQTRCVAGRELDKRVPLVAAVLCVAAIVFLAPRFLDLVARMGFMIPELDMPTDYVKGLIWALVLTASIMFWPVSSKNKRLLLIGWSVKVVVTLLFMLFYEGHYWLDSYGYFESSRAMDFQVQELSFQHGTMNVGNFARLHRQLLPDSYHAMKVSFALLGLIGIYLFYRAAVIILQKEDTRLFYLLALFPGILFWSSILGKDPIVFFGIALYCYGVCGWYRLKQLRYLAAICFGILTAVFIRQWLGVIMVIPMGVTLLFGLQNALSRLFFMLFSVTVGYFSAVPFMERFKIQAFEDVLSAADRTTKGFVGTTGGSTQTLNFDFSSPLGLLSFLPYGVFTALFRPLPGEVMNPFGLLAGLESLVLVILLVRAVIRTKLSELKEPLVLWALLFVVTWAIINGIVSSTNFGIGVRYKLQVLPIMLGLLMYLSRKRGGGVPLPATPSS